MIENKEQTITNRAWDNLFARLEHDGLIDNSGGGVVIPWRWIAGIAAMLCVVATVGWWISGTATHDNFALRNDASGSALVTMLDDGTVVWLDENAALNCSEHFGTNRREVQLRGQAFFDVCSSDLPFIIETAAASVRVLGTAFTVNEQGRSDFMLSVSRGKVAVDLKNGKPTITVEAGQTVLYHSDRTVILHNENGIFAEFNRRFHFKDEKLGNVIDILNRRPEAVRLEVAPELADRRLTVAFDGDDADGMADLICMALNLHQTRRNNSIFISANN
ncbi:MAG: FecR domain-containing protein [Tannerella sp.]|jgi:ferric-dicitrate binding protein FerR (iron transport regulator)|nr:FecR domain-containing protein [Tannerella sp.]